MDESHKNVFEFQPQTTCFICLFSFFLLQLARVSHKNKHLQSSSCLRKDIITSLAGCLALLENELYLTLNYVILGLSQRMFLL